MKNVNLQIRKLSKAGFSLVEMLVVIAVIGIIAAIAIPNIGAINSQAKDATARRNAQSCASIAAAAVAAGAPDSGSVAQWYTDLQSGVSPTTGAFKDTKFTVPNLPSDSTDSDAVKNYLDYDAAKGGLIYTGGSAQQ